MDNKRSKGVTILGWMVLLSNAFVLFGSFNQMLYLESTIRPLGTFFYFCPIFFALLAFVLTIYILQLKDWARKYFVILNTFLIVWLLISPLMMGKDCYMPIDKYVKQNQQHLTPEQMNNYEKFKIILAEKTKRLTIHEKAKIQESTPKVVNVFLFIFLLWYLLLIYFFTRPKVKEQFK